MARRRLHPLLWVLMGILALIGLNAVVIHVWGVNLFEEFAEFLTGMGAIVLVGLADGDPQQDIMDLVNARERSRRASRSRLSLWLKSVLAVMVVVLLLLYLLQPSSAVFYWFSVAVLELSKFVWFVVTTFWLLFAGVFIGVMAESKLPLLSFRHLNDPRPVKRWVKPRTITVHDGEVLSVQGWDGMTYVTPLDNTVWEGWRIKVKRPVVTEMKDRKIVVLDTADKATSERVDLKRELWEAKQTIQRLRWESRQARRNDQDLQQGR